MKRENSTSIIKSNDLIEVVANDYYGQNLRDKVVGVNNTPKKRPAGLVDVFIDDKKVVDHKGNLTLYVGRQQIAQKIFNVKNVNISPELNEAIYWAGLGSGGANLSDPFVPIPPVNNDIGLYQEVPLSTESTNHADLRGDNYYYKKLIESVTFEPDSDNDNAWLVVKANVYFDTGEAEGEKINEACLFMSSSNANGTSGPFHAYGRITFDTVTKPVGRAMRIIWYLFF